MLEVARNPMGPAVADWDTVKNGLAHNGWVTLGPCCSTRLVLRLLVLDLVVARVSVIMRRTKSAVTLALAVAVGDGEEVLAVGLSVA